MMPDFEISAFEEMAHDILEAGNPLEDIPENISEILRHLITSRNFGSLSGILEKLLQTHQSNDYLFFLQSLCLLKADRPDLSVNCINQALTLDRLLRGESNAQLYEKLRNHLVDQCNGLSSSAKSSPANGARSYSPKDFLSLNYQNLPEQIEKREAAITAGIPPILMVSMPSAASQYILYYMACGLDVCIFPTTLNNFPRSIFAPVLLDDFQRGAAVSTSHPLPSDANLNTLSRSHLSKMLVHLRDPRQAFFSFFYHLEHQTWQLRHMYYEHLPRGYEDLPIEKKIDWNIDNAYEPLWADWVAGWNEFARSPASGMEVKLVTFEKFKTDPEGYFAEIADFFGFDEKLLKNDRQLQYEHHSNEVLKGSLDAWRTGLTPSQQKKIQDLTPDRILEDCGWKR